MESPLGSNRYFVDVALEPRPTVRPNHLLEPPLVVSLHRGKKRSNAKPSEDRSAHDYGSPLRQACSQADRIESAADLESLWAFVHLVPESVLEPGAIASCAPAVLSGSLASTVTLRENDGKSDTIGYFKFADLTIKEAGTYRLLIALCRMNAPRDDPSSTDGGATTIACVTTGKFLVRSPGPHCSSGRVLCQ